MQLSRRQADLVKLQRKECLERCGEAGIGVRAVEELLEEERRTWMAEPRTVPRSRQCTRCSVYGEHLSSTALRVLQVAAMESLPQLYAAPSRVAAAAKVLRRWSKLSRRYMPIKLHLVVVVLVVATTQQPSWAARRCTRRRWVPTTSRWRTW